MKIVLMRHGRPEIHLESLRHILKSPAETGQVIVDYEFGALDSEQTPPKRSLDIAKICEAKFSSDLPRAITSMNMLGHQDNIEIDDCFRESNQPYLTWTRPKLQFFTWCFIFRVAWFLGFAKNGESVSKGRQRAEICATKLAEAAHNQDSVLLLAHGIINHLITSELKRQGWRKTQNTNNDYWSYAILEKVRTNK